MNDHLKKRAGERGASLVEYALLVALIALVCVSAIGALGTATTEPLNEAEIGLN